MGKTALVLEGGALRTFYTMGVLDALMDAKIEFEYICGVSGGALCAMNYLSEQKGRTVDLNMTFINDKRYKGISTLFKTKSYFNIEFLFGKEVEAFRAFDYDKYLTTKTHFELAATNAETGEAEFFEKPTRDQFNRIVATASVPFVSQMVTINDQRYLDGGISAPIPYQRALEQGYDRIVVVMTQDKTYRKNEPSPFMKRLIKRLYRRNPQLAEKIINRHQFYNNDKKTVEEASEKGRMFMLQPEVPVEVSRFEKDQDKLKALYDQGVKETTSKVEAIRQFLL